MSVAPSTATIDAIFQHLCCSRSTRFTGVFQDILALGPRVTVPEFYRAFEAWKELGETAIQNGLSHLQISGGSQ